MFAHAVPEVSADRKGIHVLWAGPREWLYSPQGWTIQRRKYERERVELDCIEVSPADIERLRARHELTTRHGVLTLRQGQWVQPLTGLSAFASGVSEPCDVITLELAATPSFVRAIVQASASFVIGLRDGKTVAGGGVIPGAATHDLSAPALDTVVLYTLGLKGFTACVAREADATSWDDVSIVKRLQLPIRELMPSLADVDDEYAEAKSRLLSGESLDEAEFALVADNLRVLVKADGPPRPIDLALLLRDHPDGDPQELCALDPIRTLLIHPRWRRVIGLGWFDDDPQLDPGHGYEYRITGGFPTTDVYHRVAGFHTVPSQTALPAEVFLGAVRLRFPQPRVVERAKDDHEPRGVTRRGVRLASRDEPWWHVPSLDDWSAVIDFPDPVESLELDIEPGHALRYAHGAPWTTPSAPLPLPPGPRAHLTFPAPIHQLLLDGRGFLESVRIPIAGAPATEHVSLSALTGPVEFVDSPLPPPPPFAELANLHQAPTVATEDQPSGPPQPPHTLGFEIRWLPAPRPGVSGWPPDADAAPPLESTLFQIEHKQVAPTATEWTAVADDENYTAGDRSYGTETSPIHTGVDLMTVFPEARAAAAGAVDLFWRDVFDFNDDGSDATDLPRPPPSPGTVHRYRVRAVDPIGRPSATWAETGDLRLEKHVPPPLPAAPDLTPADKLPEPAITGVRARVLVRDAPDLTGAEQATLGTHDNAIILTWGWHDEQRRQDPYAREFRVYTNRRPPGRVRATILGVVPQGIDRFDAAINGDREFAANAARGSITDAGTQFRVLSHGAGPSTTLALRSLERDADGAYLAPAAGDIEMPIRLTPEQTRAAFWADRVAVQAIDSRTVYSETLFDLLDLTPEHPTDVVHVGVSAADAESYVPDPLAPAANRPGNESPVAGVRCEGHWYGRPVIVEAPSLAPVPVVVTPEPGARPLLFPLDLSPHTTLPPATRVRPERVLDDEVFRAYRVDGNRLIARVVDPPEAGETEQEVGIPNAADRAAILAAISGGAVPSLEDRFVVYLASVHPYRGRLFRGATPEPVALGEFQETLPNRGARWVYRLRVADAAGHVSADGVTLRVIVRVPTTTALAAPVRIEGGPSRVVLRVAGGSEVTDLLVFGHALESSAAPRAEAELLRIASSTGGAGDRVRLRLPDGTLLAPSLKSLADPDVVRDGPWRMVELEIAADDQERVWACAATRDAVVSPPGGPWRVPGEISP
jgi:hypothetical protein